MHYYSTNQQAPLASLEEAVVRGLATDKGLYMPERIKQLPKEFFDGIAEMSFQEIADQTEVSINTALGRMRYALINLRKMIKENNVILN